MQVGEVELLAGRVRQQLVVLLQDLVKALHDQTGARACLELHVTFCNLVNKYMCRSKSKINPSPHLPQKDATDIPHRRCEFCCNRARNKRLSYSREQQGQSAYQVVEIHKLLQCQELISNILGFLQDRHNTQIKDLRQCVYKELLQWQPLACMLDLHAALKGSA